MKGTAKTKIGIILIMMCLSTLSVSVHGAEPWTNLGLYGGQVSAIAVDPGNGDIIYAGTYLGGGAYKSDDGGATWTAMKMAHLLEGEDTFEGQSVTAVAVAPSDSNVVWASHNYWLANSRDGGQTWEHIRHDTVQSLCTDCSGDADAWRFGLAIAIHPTDADIVYVSMTGPAVSNAGGAVFKTEDGGVSWTKLNQGENLDYRVEDIAFDPQNPDIVWAVTNANGYNNIWDGTVYRSVNGGDTFLPIDPKPTSGGILAIAPKPDDSDTIFIGCGYGLVMLRRNGDQWQAEYTSPGSLMVSDVAFAPSDPRTLYFSWLPPVYYGGTGLPQLTRGRYIDSQWVWHTSIADSTAVSQLNVIDVHPTNPDIVFGGDQTLGMVQALFEGENFTWANINMGLDAVLVYDVDVEDGNTAHMLAATNAGLYERASGDAQWTRRHVGTFRSAAFQPGSATTYYGGLTGWLARTDDGGLTWNYSNSLGSVNIEDITIHPSTPQTVFIATGHVGRQIQRSTDGGAKFTPVLDGVNVYGQAYAINSVTIDPADPDHLFAGGGNYYIPYVSGDLWESSDGGNSWQRTGLTNIIVNSVMIDPRDSQIMYAGCGYSSNYYDPLWKSVDGGQNWTAMTEGMPPPRRTLYSIWAGDENHIFTVGSYGYLVSYDGNRWLSSEGPIESTLYGVHGTANNDVFAVGYGGAIFHFDGLDWQLMDNGTTTTLYKVWAAAPDNVYAVGQGGRILHYDGVQWLPMNSPVTNTLYEIRGTSADNIFAAGVNGTILHFDGSQWRTQDSGVSATLSGVWVFDKDDAFATGADGTILRYGPGGWQTMDNPGENYLNAIWGSDPTNVYVTGSSGELLHFDGQTWSMIDSSPGHFYQEIWGLAEDRIYITDATGGVWYYDGQTLSLSRERGTIYRSVVDVAFHHSNSDIVYAATSKAGIYLSPDAAGNWLNLGAPPTMTYALAVGSLYAATGSGLFQCTGTGVLAGNIHESETGAAIDGAVLTSDLGTRGLSFNGRYMMLLPAGEFNVFATMQGFRTEAADRLQILGSDVTWHDFDLQPSGTTSPLGDEALPSTSSGDGTGGAYCFIGTLSAGPATMKGSPGLLPMVFAILGCAALPFTLFRSKLFWGSLILIVAIGIAGLAPAFGATLFQQVGISSPPVPVGSGARALGMGGAFIAVADDATAASWNPAGLIQVERPEFSAVVDYQTRCSDFTSRLHPESNKIEHDDQTDFNYFSLTVPFNPGRNMVLSLNYQQLYDFNRSLSYLVDFVSSGTSLNQNVSFDQAGQVSALGIASALEITPALSFGVTMNIWSDQFGWQNGWTSNYQARSNGTLSGMPVTIDSEISEEYERFRGVNFNLGLFWESSGSGTFGAVVKTPFKATIRHHFTLTQSTVYGSPLNSSVVDGPITIDENVTLDMPLSYGLGWSKRFSDTTIFSMDITRTHWEQFRLTDSQGNEFNPIDGRPAGESNIGPTISLRAGWEHVFLYPEKQTALPIRFGLFYDPEPTAGSNRNYYGFSLGGGVSRPRFSFDVAYQLRWGDKVDAGNLINDAGAEVRQHTILASFIYYF